MKPIINFSVKKLDHTSHTLHVVLEDLIAGLEIEMKYELTISDVLLVDASIKNTVNK